MPNDVNMPNETQTKLAVYVGSVIDIECCINL